MTVYTLLAPVVAIIWSLANRGRGWGPAAGAPKWKVYAAKACNRYTMSAVCAGSLTGYAYLLGFSELECRLLFGSVFLGWYLGVLPGWGEYFDGSNNRNHEVKFIDDFMFWVAHHVPLTGSQIDNISFGLRGVFYLPLFIMAGLALQSWAFVLPALFFWQDGIVYGTARRTVTGDYVRAAEFAGGAFRGYLMACAVALTYFMRTIM